jgi:Mg/Co/Ni transporter MgtE
MLDATLSRFDAGHSFTVPVIQDGRLIGLLTADAVVEFLRIQAALDHAPASQR